MKAKVLTVCVLGLLLALSASAEKEVWFPYAYVDNVAATAPVHNGVYGLYGSSLYDQIGTTTANAIWNESRVFYLNGSTYESWWDYRDDMRAFIISIMGNYYPFTNTAPLKIYIYNADGTLATATTKWKLYSGGDSTTGLINTSAATSPFIWNATDSCFDVELGSYNAINICSWTGTYNLFNTPPTSENVYQSPHIKMVATGDQTFDATIRGNSVYKYRTSTGDSGFSNFKVSTGFSYSGLEKWWADDETETGLRFISLPFFREKYSTTDTVLEWTNLVTVVNAYEGAATTSIVVYVLTQDQSVSTSYAFTNVPMYGRVSFSPSQFYSSSPTATQDGMVNTSKGGTISTVCREI